MNELQKKIANMKISSQITISSLEYFSMVAEKFRLGVEKLNKISEELTMTNLTKSLKILQKKLETNIIILDNIQN